MNHLQRYLPAIAIGLLAVLGALWVVPGLLRGGYGLLLLAGVIVLGFLYVRRQGHSFSRRRVPGYKPAEPGDPDYPDELEMVVYQVAKRNAGHVRAEDVAGAVPGITLALAEELLQMLARQERAELIEGDTGPWYRLLDADAGSPDEPPLLN